MIVWQELTDGVVTAELSDSGYRELVDGQWVERPLTPQEAADVAIAAESEAAAAAAVQDATVRRDLIVALSKGRTYATALTTDPTGDHTALRDDLATTARAATLAYSTLVFSGGTTVDTDRIAFLVQARIADLREIEKALGL